MNITKTNNTEIFNFNGNLLRTINIDNETWFVAKDVCDCLEVSNSSQALSRLDDDERNTIILNEGIGNPEKSIVNESGLYSLILSSRKEESKIFKKWVTSEVIPSIRKNGGYILNQETMTPEQILANAILVAQNVIEEQKRQLEHQKPYVNFAMSIENSSDSIPLGAYSKLLANDGIKIGRNRLFQWMRDNGYLIKNGRERNNPMQKYIDQGLFEVKEQIVHSVKGDILTNTTLLKGKGQIYFLDKLRNV